MSTTVRTFSLQGVALTIGALLFRGFAEGDAITFTFTGDDIDVSQGSDGEVLYTLKHNKVVDVVIRLTQGNPLIDQVIALHKLSISTPTGPIPWPLSYVELAGTAVITGAVVFKQYPPKKAADTGQPVEIMASMAVGRWEGGALIPSV